MMSLGTADYSEVEALRNPFPRPAPAAPQSLAPVAMSAYMDAAATGPQVAQRPSQASFGGPQLSMKTGLVMVMAGVLLGAVFGIGLHARGAVTAGAAPRAEKAMTASPTPTPTIDINARAPLAAPQAYANVPFGSLVVTPTAAQPPVASPATPTTNTAVAATPTKAEKTEKAEKPKRWSAGRSWVKAAPKEKDDYKVASASPDEVKEPKEAKEPKAKPSKDEARKAQAEAKRERAEAKSGKASSTEDADKVLKAAMGATENTL